MSLSTGTSLECDMKRDVSPARSNSEKLSDAPPIAVRRAGSVAKEFEPKFLAIFEAFQETIQPTFPIDLTRPLMSLCLHYLIPFCCWIRSSNEMHSWIKAVLEDNADLRPEVRNGLAMILMYCLSSAKSFAMKAEDMFAVLQDSEIGMGIVSKTSLKVYNDPFHYFIFLKYCVTGLIDAGLIPENERINQPKKPKSKISSEKQEEINSFCRLKDVLIHSLDNRDTATVIDRVKKISTIWQHSDKRIRSNWFIVALKVLDGSFFNTTSTSGILGIPISTLSSTSDTASFSMMSTIPDVTLPDLSRKALQSTLPLREDIMSTNDSAMSLLTLAAAGAALARDHLDLNSQEEGDVIERQQKIRRIESPHYSNRNEAIPTAAIGGHLISRLSRGMPSSSFRDILHQYPQITSSSPPLPVAATSITGITRSSSPAIPVLRFEKVSPMRWEIMTARIFDLPKFLDTFSNSIFLINESKFTEIERINLLINSSSSKIPTLQSELSSRRAIISSWSPKDFPQLICFLDQWQQQQQQQQSNVGLISFWHRDNKCSDAVGGSIAYELVSQIGFIVRGNTSVGIMESWRLLYLYELDLEDPSMSFGQSIGKLFVQWHLKLQELMKSKTIVVQCYSHDVGSSIRTPPQAVADELYQTMGTLDMNALELLGRLDSSKNFHDFKFVDVQL